jgi:hypothetical protein
MTANELSLKYTADSTEDYYFIFERVSFQPHHRLSLDDFEASLNKMHDKKDSTEEEGEEEEQVEGEISFMVLPMVHDITYANDWERGSIVKVLCYSPFLSTKLFNLLFRISVMESLIIWFLQILIWLKSHSPN